MIITKASLEDAAPVLELQRLAFYGEAEIYGDFSIPPLIQTLEEIKGEFSTKTVLKAVLDGRLIGSVRAWEQGDACYIERLIVHPDLQGQGIGTKLMVQIEDFFPDARRFELFTGHRSERNIHLYKKLGYQAFKEQRVNDKLIFTYMGKSKSRSGSADSGETEEK
jgi:ribosomal protein S18 acetylase RimI-like enzyme